MEHLLLLIKKHFLLILVIVIPVTLYITGLQTEAIGRVQQLLLWTNILTPNIEPVTNEKKVMARYDFAIYDLDGQKVPFTSFKGKTVFINFWATWCPPCIAELPNINKLYKKIKSEKVAFVILSVDRNPDLVPEFVNKRGFTFPVYILKDTLPAVYKISSIPSTYVISPQGEIVFNNKGMANYDSKFFMDFLVQL